MRRARFIIAFGFASILALAVAPASAQDRSGGDSRSGGVAQSGGGGARVAAAPRAGVRYYAPVRFFAPYYTFRPRVSVGFGLFIGYPIAYTNSFYYPGYFYPDAYPYSYAYPYPYAYRYAYVYPYSAPGPTYHQAPAGLDPPQAQNSVGVQPPPTYQAPAGLDPTGGLSFEITPSDAHVIVDGRDVGSVGQFTPTSQALGLPVGRHHIEIVANGYRTMSSDVDVRPGQVIPFQGQMER
jgi:PEGA domain-containing protein